MLEEAELKALDYTEERVELTARNARWAILAGLLINPLFLFVDSASGTASWTSALVARGQCELCLAICLAVVLFVRARRLLLFVLASCSLLSLAGMLGYLRIQAAVQIGFYDWGLSLVLLALVLFFPVRLLEYLLLAAPTAAVYLVFVLLSDSTGAQLGASIVAVLSPLGIGIAAAVLLEAGRQRAFRYRDRVNMLNLKLADANERLEGTNQAMTEFMAICSHDLKNKINAIGNAAELLKGYGSQMEEDKRIGYLDSIEEEALAMARLIRDFLDLAALESGAISLELQPSLLADIARVAERTASLAGAPREIAVDLDVEADLPSISVDPDRLTQILDNLLGNAIRHSPDGGTVRIAVRSLAEGGQCIEVADEGEGVPEEDRLRIFGRFIAGEQRGAAGLGLAIVKQLVTLHGGGIEVGGDVGKGAVFRVMLPPQVDSPASDR